MLNQPGLLRCDLIEHFELRVQFAGFGLRLLIAEETELFTASVDVENGVDGLVEGHFGLEQPALDIDTHGDRWLYLVRDAIFAHLPYRRPRARFSLLKTKNNIKFVSKKRILLATFPNIILISFWRSADV